MAAGHSHRRTRADNGVCYNQHPHPKPKQAEKSVSKAGGFAEADGFHIGSDESKRDALAVGRRSCRAHRTRRTKGMELAA